MALSKQEQFEKLLEQIDYADPHLTGGVIDQVVVHQQSRVWELHLHLREVLPLAVFTQLEQKTAVSFHQLAKAQVRFEITTDQGELAQNLISDYWPYGSGWWPAIRRWPRKSA